MGRHLIFQKKTRMSLVKSSKLGITGIQRFSHGCPSWKLKDKDGSAIHMSHDAYTPESSRAHKDMPLIDSSVKFPKSATVVDLDGMEERNNNEKSLTYGGVMEFKNQKAIDYMGCIRQPHPIWTKEECDSVEITHVKPQGMTCKTAYGIVWLLRRAFDLGTGYSLGIKGEQAMLRRIIILETVAGLPGMIGAFIRHMRSLRRGTKDYGWIHSLLEEAENERMHLMIGMSLRDLGFVVRSIVYIAQALVGTAYFTAYSISPKFCHSFVGYLEEEAVKTYTQILDLIDQGKLQGFHMTAPKAAKDYYHLPDDACFRDIITNIRADEAHHRQLNHCLAHMGATEVNPFPPGF